MTRKSQDELEQPAKVYQLDAVETKVDQAISKLDTLLEQTSGVVTHKQMEDYVAKEIEDAIVPYKTHKALVSRVGWLLLSLIITDLAVRLFGLIK
jgi:L-lactate utilization protein LutB